MVQEHKPEETQPESLASESSSESEMDLPSTEAVKNQEELRSLIGHAFFAGLCPLIPVPFVDDWVRDGIRRRMVRRQLAEESLEVQPKKLHALACGHDPVTAKGCIGGCFTWAIKVPIDFVFKLVFKKILRKIVIFLAVKDCVDTFSAVFHEGFLVRHALGRDHVCAHCLSDESHFDHTVALRRHVEAVRDEVDHRPVERWAGQAFQGSRRLLRQSARLISKTLRRRKGDGELSDQEVFAEVDPHDERLDSLIDELTEEIAGETGYLNDLKQRLDQRLDGVGVEEPES